MELFYARSEYWSQFIIRLAYFVESGLRCVLLTGWRKGKNGNEIIWIIYIISVWYDRQCTTMAWIDGPITVLCYNVLVWVTTGNFIGCLIQSGFRSMHHNVINYLRIAWRWHPLVSCRSMISTTAAMPRNSFDQTTSYQIRFWILEWKSFPTYMISLTTPQCQFKLEPSTSVCLARFQPVCRRWTHYVGWN